MAILLALFSIVQTAEASSKMQRFQLYTRCLGVHLVVEELPDNAERINLTREQIIKVAMDKLQKAQLYVPRKFVVGAPDEIHPILYVNVNLSRTAFSIGIELRKVVLDNYSKREEYAVTWRIGTVGVHGFRNQFILRMVDKYTGVFIEEWTRVNRPKCAEDDMIKPEQGPIQPPVRIK